MFQLVHHAERAVGEYNQRDLGTIINAGGASELIADGSQTDGRTRVAGGDVFNEVTLMQDFLTFMTQEQYEGITPVQYPVVFDPETKVQVFGVALKDIETVHKYIEAANSKYVKGYEKKTQSTVGKVEGGKEALQIILKVTGKKGRWVREDKGGELEFWGVKANLPDGFEALYATTDDVTQFTFPKKPSVNLIIIQLTLSGVTVSPDKIKLNIDWWPDYPVDLE